MRKNDTFEVGPRICQQSTEKKKDIVSLRVMNSIHYKESLMLLEAYVAALDVFIL
jgi:hypothetical protein